MRLINIDTMTLVDFPGRPPPYAILSHRWEEKEVTYHEFQDGKRRETRQGFKRIRFTCEQAKKDALGYAWVDTCRIDKSSSAELSEAINSMFKWYREATFCYAYLSDVLSTTHQCTLLPFLERQFGFYFSYLPEGVEVTYIITFMSMRY